MKLFALLGMLGSLLYLLLDIFFPPVWLREIESHKVYTILGFTIQTIFFYLLYRKLKKWIMIAAIGFGVAALLIYEQIW